MVAPAAGVEFSTMAIDQEYQRHLHGWLGFARLMRWVVAAIIIVLIGMAYFLA
jgi:hypothetical protein